MKPVSHREAIELPVGFEERGGEIHRDAEVRAVTGGDEMWIGMSPEYNRNPNDLVYKSLLLSRCVTRLGPKTLITVGDIQRLHARDVRALEYAIYRLTYGDDSIPEPDGPSG